MVTEFAQAAEGHRRELLLHCYRMLGSLLDAEDAVQETMLRAWRYRDSLKEGAPLRPWLVEATEAADFRALESIIRRDATFRMPPQPGVAEGRDAMFSLWVAGGFGSEGFGRLRCVVTRANLQPAVAAYVRQRGDSAWRALAMDVLRIEDGVIAEIVTFPPDCFLPFGLPLIMDEASEVDTCH